MTHRFERFDVVDWRGLVVGSVFGGYGFGGQWIEVHVRTGVRCPPAAIRGEVPVLRGRPHISFAIPGYVVGIHVFQPLSGLEELVALGASLRYGTEKLYLLL